MGYIIGGRYLVEGSDSNFKEALKARVAVEKVAGVVEVPKIVPERGTAFAFKKQAAALDITRNAPLFNDPRYTASTLAIPTDERTLHGLYRFFADTDPIVGAALKIHADLPLADLSLGECEDSGVQAHYVEMWERIGGHRLLNEIVNEHNEIGNVFPFGAFNETDYMWDQFAILNPDYIKVESTWVNQRPLIKLIPDEALKRVVQTQSPRFIYDQLPLEIRKYVLYNQEIPLDPNNVFHLAHAKRPYELRGKSLIKRILKTLMLEDRFNQANFALATRHAVPITVVKVGDPQSLEENHLITFMEGDILKVISFNDFWNSYSGPIQTYAEGKEVKDVREYDLYTQSLTDGGTYIWNKINFILRHPTPDDIVQVSTPYAKTRSTYGHGYVRMNPESLQLESVDVSTLQGRSAPAIITMDRFDYKVLAQMVLGVPLNSDLAYFIGLWNVDRYFEQIGEFELLASSKDEAIKRYLQEDLVKAGFVEQVYTVHGRHETRIKCSKSVSYLFHVYEFNQRIKGRADVEKERVFTSILFNSDPRVVGAFFSGLVDGGGVIHKRRCKVSITCKSKEFLHWLSLGLLAQGIRSSVKDITKTTSSLRIFGKDNVYYFLQLIIPFLRHSKKVRRGHLLLNALEGAVGLRGAEDYVYDLSDSNLQELFENSNFRDLQDGVALIKFKKYNIRLTRFFANLAGGNGRVLDVINRFCGVEITNIKRVKKRSRFVYDLMLEQSPHNYLAAGDGWQLVHNSGWVPNQEELSEVRELFCHDEQTEVLTENGFKRYDEVLPGERIAGFDKATESMIYETPKKLHVYEHDGEMLHFNSRSTDICVTGHHRMLVKRSGDWTVVPANAVTHTDYFRGSVNWEAEVTAVPTMISRGGETVSLEDWLELGGRYISGGSSTRAAVSISQGSGASCNQVIADLCNRLPWKYEIVNNGKIYRLYGEQLRADLIADFGQSDKNRFIPTWGLQLPKKYLKIILTSYLSSDGYEISLKSQRETFSATTVSARLANNLQELCLKLGYCTNVFSYSSNEIEIDGSSHQQLYILEASGGQQLCSTGVVAEKAGGIMTSNVRRVAYKGRVWCFTTPSGFFVTRRNGKVTVQGNSAYELDPNFSIFYHYGIDVQFYGSNGRMLPIGPELERLYRLKFIGMGIHEQLLTGAGGTYSVPGDHSVVYRDAKGSHYSDFADLWAAFDVPIMVDNFYEIKDTLEFGLHTISLDNEGKVVWTPIKQIIRHKLMPKDRLIQVKTDSANVISTEGHGFMWLNRKTWKYEEVSAKDLKENDTLVDILDLSSLGQAYPEIWEHLLTEELAYFLGVWKGDEDVGGNTECDIQFNSNSIELVEHVRSVVCRLPFDRIVEKSTLGTGEHSLCLYWKELKLNLCEYYGVPMCSKSMYKLDKKSIPEAILFNADPRIVGAYIAGELDVDGDVSNNQVRFSSVSKTYLKQVALMLRRFGIVPSAITERTTTESVTATLEDNRKHYHMVISGASNLRTLYALVGSFVGLEYKLNALKKLAANTSLELNCNVYYNKVDTSARLVNCDQVLKSFSYSAFEKAQASKFDTVRVRELVDVESAGGYVYDLGLSTVPNTYMVCGDGWLLNHNSQAYINLEIQRQRYLNLQLKLEDFVHHGIFKPVADLCGFYRVQNTFIGYGGATNHKWGKISDIEHRLKNNFTSLRDSQDNKDFNEFIRTKALEAAQAAQRQTREYIYPELDWGGMSAATDESLKNYLKWLADKRPHLVDDATLANLGRLNRDKQEKAYIKDLVRAKERIKLIHEKGLDPFVDKKGKSGGGESFDIGGDLEFGGGGGLDFGGNFPGEPNAPIGEGGPPDTATGEEPPAGLASLISAVDSEYDGIVAGVADDLEQLKSETEKLLKAKKGDKKLSYKNTGLSKAEQSVLQNFINTEGV